MNCARTRFVVAFCLLSCPVSGTLASGGEEYTNSLGMTMIHIDPGTFVMGSNLSRDHWDERPAHNVTISQAFQVSRTEVTIDQFRQFRPDFQPTPGFVLDVLGNKLVLIECSLHGPPVVFVV